MKQKFWIVLIFMALLFSGCARTKIVDQLSILHTIGYDRDEAGQFRGTFLYPDYTQGKNKDSIQIRKARGKTSSMMTARSNEQTKKPIELSKTQVFVFGEDFAKQGIGHIIDTVFNNPIISTDIQTAVVKPSAREFLEQVQKKGSLTLSETIEQNFTTQSLPRTSLHLFLNDFYGQGRDPYMPILEMGTEANEYVKGLAVFKDDKLKLTLDSYQTFLFGLLDRFNHQGVSEVPIQKGKKKGIFILRIMKEKPEWRNIQGGSSPRIDLLLNVFVIIREYPEWINLHDEKDIHLLEHAIEITLKQDIGKLLDTFKEYGVDPIGIGDKIRGRDRRWNEQRFYRVEYKKLKSNIDISTTIIQAGIKR
ncbi:Ger(x)C family spore germination protein [Neobacillus notoginsengisoli]|uniref:Ger(X)C family spore germination protein n=1 Tax=Neobacillus notoginsengisoli TaxID=1578198 RepID=A0A417YWB4_9BACI|nr:Ger(x)C family spore germination protein [Neobacillus notoginsengisoli]RHW41697.1 Ger(x)C family spore germination protein [Neobacillus notoginsengisoli]